MVKTQPSQHDGAVVVTLRSPATAVKAELALPDARRALAGEFLGCLLFIVFGAGTVAVTGGLLGEKLTSARLLAIALVHGLAFALLVSAMRRISGGHLNPAVTFAVLIRRQIGLTKAVLYVLSQCSGAVAGALLLTLIIPSPLQGNLVAHDLGMRVTVGGGLLTEILITFMLVSAVLAATAASTRPVSTGLVAIGLSVIVGQLFGVPLTGGSMNPARSFGPALVVGVWTNHWIFWVGPLVGGAVAAFGYEFFVSDDGTEHAKGGVSSSR
jgi:MIP family channel proteins